MIGVVVVTHGQLATELVNAAEMIVGDLPRFAAVSIGWHDDVNDAREDIAQAIERVRGDAGVLLLTDMFGGTPSNLGMTFLETDRPELISAGGGILGGTEPRALARHVDRLLSDNARLARMSRAPNPFGDGRAAPRIAAALRAYLKAPRGGGRVSSKRGPKPAKGG